MKNLYLVSTSGLGQFHVIANDPTEAENALVKIFNEQDYGFRGDRRVIDIKWLAEAFKPDFRDNKKPFLSDKETRLLIVQHWA
jgi:hypothetical protein